MSEQKCKEQLLMYHDKRFQLELLFSLVALNHEQIKSSTTAGYLLADKNKFQDVAQRLMTINEHVLASLIERMKHSSVKPETDKEKSASDYYLILTTSTTRCRDL